MHQESPATSLPRPPRVSIGLPVRNGQRYLRQVLDSLLAQTYADLEVLIADNGSTDDTRAICQEYVARDPRVRYFRSDTDEGPAWNFNRLVPLARGEYFRWAAADDLLAPQYLARCVEALDANADAVCAYPDTVVIDDAGERVGSNDYHLALDAPSPARRFASLALVDHRRHGAYEIFGLYRTDALRRTPLFEAYARGDSVLLARLALLGRFVRVPEPLFLNRDHGRRSARHKPTGPGRGSSWLAPYLGLGPMPPDEWWDISKRGRLTFPEWNLARRYGHSALGAPLAVGQKVACLAVVAVWTLINLHKLARDVLYAVDHGLQLARLRLSGAADQDQPTVAPASSAATRD